MNLHIIKVFSICVLIFLLGFFMNSIYNKYTDRTNKDDLFHTQTICFKDSKKINFDEEYALSVTIKIYEQLYNKLYNKDDFVIEEVNFGNYCWNVYLKEPRKEFLKKYDNDLMFDGKNGLIIDKLCGAVVANYGENYS